MAGAGLPNTTSRDNAAATEACIQSSFHLLRDSWPCSLSSTMIAMRSYEDSDSCPIFSMALCRCAFTSGLLAVRKSLRPCFWMRLAISTTFRPAGPASDNTCTPKCNPAPQSPVANSYMGC